MTTTPLACLIIIGNEILSGRTKDTNLAWLAERLNIIGVRMYEARVIPDIETIIVDTVNECRARFDYVFTTGGIGPTHDDITTASIAKAFGVAVRRHPEAEALLRAHYTPEQINEARLKMAEIPEGATLIANPVSAAPGFQLENVFVMAGVPRIMQAMFDDIRPRLKGGAPMQSRLLSCNLAEGTYAAALDAIQQRHPSVEIGSYPHFRAGAGVLTSLVARGLDPQALDAAFAEIRAMVEQLGGAILPPPEPA